MTKTKIMRENKIQNLSIVIDPIELVIAKIKIRYDYYMSYNESLSVQHCFKRSHFHLKLNYWRYINILRHTYSQDAHYWPSAPFGLLI